MPEIIFIEHNGTEHRVSAATGQSVMEAAMAQMVPGLLADCGGNGSCATCHGIVAAAWQERLPPASADELLMLEMSPEHCDGSRLTCQIPVTDDLDGLVIRWPETQG
jgi:2Fe-2S ferredoxin